MLVVELVKKPLLKFEYENDYANDNDILVENNDGAINHLILLFLPPPHLEICVRNRRVGSLTDNNPTSIW